jgi:membrane fusion protein, multidrug efflux system
MNTYPSAPITAGAQIRSLLSGLFLLILLAFFSGCSADNREGKGNAEERPKKRAVPVLVGHVEKKTVPVELRAIGTVEPFATVDIKSQIAGILQSIHFKEGDEVRKGDLLFTIDPRPFAAMLNQAQGALARDRAELENARKELERYTQAAKKGYVSTEQADQAETKVATLAATIKADEAAVENARLQLEFCSILAPIDGRTGQIPVAEGNLIKASADTAMVTINQVSPIKVSFSVPSRHFSELKKYRSAGTLKVLIAEPAGAEVEGEFSFLDNSVDSTTGTLLLKAQAANRDRTLWPGQFVDVRLILTSRPDVAVVPSQAIQIGQTGAHVFVVKEDQTVESRPIVTGMIVGNETVVESGLTPGEKVVTDGQLQVSDGAKVADRTAASAAQAGLPPAPDREAPRGKL